MTIVLNTAHQSYWDGLKEAVTLVTAYEKLYEIAMEAPQYTAGRWSDELDAYEPVENLGPWDNVVHARNAISNHPRALMMAKALKLEGLRWA